VCSEAAAVFAGLVKRVAVNPSREQVRPQKRGQLVILEGCPSLVYEQQITQYLSRAQGDR
jgi:hypothetical protein